MKVKLNISRAGKGFSQNAGDEIEVSDEEGRRLIELAKAEPVRQKRKETATKKITAEKASD